VSGVYSRPSGVYDLLPERFARRARLEALLLGRMAERGFRQVAPPTLEYLDLYGPDRLGEDLYHHLILARLAASAEFPTPLSDATGLQPSTPLYQAALRPDLTTPLARMYVTGLLKAPRRPEAPSRWSAAGQVFRDRVSGDARRIEFRQLGAELFGARGVAADLEVIGLGVDCVEGLDFLGRAPERALLYLGHTGLFRALLELGGLRGRRLEAVASDLVSASGIWLRLLMSRTLGEPEGGGVAAFLARKRAELVGAIRPWIRQRPDSPLAPGAREDLEALEALEGPALARALPRLFQAHLRRNWLSPHQLGGERIPALDPAQADALLGLVHLGFKPDEQRLAAKDLEGAFARIDRHRRALRAAGQGDSGAADRAVQAHLDVLRALCERLAADVPWPLLITPAASRGFSYYTGVTFEIHALTGGAETSICSGGRYDQLPRLLRDRARATARVRQPGWSPPAWMADAPEDELLSGVGLAMGLDRLVSIEEALGEGAPTEESTA
jgi:ATP phosphoribosyltransferase regulatory subunit HisZ